jgi:O-antigen ligase
LGIGAGNFGEFNERMSAGVLIKKRTHQQVAHNMYLQFFVENGIFSGILFLIILSYPMLSLFKYDKFNKDEDSVYGLGFCMAASLFALLFAGLFLSTAKNPVLWFFVGIGLATSVMGRLNRIDSSKVYNA